MTKPNMGQRIQDARKKKGLTQKELAEALQLATGTIQQYELGKRVPKNDTIKAIAAKLGMTPFDLIGPEWFDVQLGEEKLTEFRNEVNELLALQKYLSSLGYSVSFDGPANAEEPDVVLIKGKTRTVFTGKQFQQFEKAISDSVNYQIWQQQNKK